MRIWISQYKLGSAYLEVEAYGTYIFYASRKVKLDPYLIFELTQHVCHLCHALSPPDGALLPCGSRLPAKHLELWPPPGAPGQAHGAEMIRNPWLIPGSPGPPLSHS